jgi:hypothetical protein
LEDARKPGSLWEKIKDTLFLVWIVADIYE